MLAAEICWCAMCKRSRKSVRSQPCCRNVPSVAMETVRVQVLIWLTMTLSWDSLKRLTVTQSWDSLNRLTVTLSWDSLNRLTVTLSWDSLKRLTVTLSCSFRQFELIDSDPILFLRTVRTDWQWPYLVLSDSLNWLTVTLSCSFRQFEQIDSDPILFLQFEQIDRDPVLFLQTVWTDWQWPYLVLSDSLNRLTVTLSCSFSLNRLTGTLSCSFRQFEQIDSDPILFFQTVWTDWQWPYLVLSDSLNRLTVTLSCSFSLKFIYWVRTAVILCYLLWLYPCCVLIFF